MAYRPSASGLCLPLQLHFSFSRSSPSLRHTPTMSKYSIRGSPSKPMSSLASGPLHKPVFSLGWVSFPCNRPTLCTVASLLAFLFFLTSPMVPGKKSSYYFYASTYPNIQHVTDTQELFAEWMSKQIKQMPKPMKEPFLWDLYFFDSTV